MGDPVVAAQLLGDQLSQLWVAEGQPPPGSDSIGLVLEFLWVQVVEVLQFKCNPLLASFGW